MSALYWLAAVVPVLLLVGAVVVTMWDDLDLVLEALAIMLAIGLLAAAFTWGVNGLVGGAS